MGTLPGFHGQYAHAQRTERGGLGEVDRVDSPLQYPRYPTSMTYGSRSVTYDTFGRIASLTLPAGMIYSYPTGAYDLEDGPIAENRTFYIGGALSLTAAPPITETVCITSNIRNEKVPNNYSPSHITSVASCGLGAQLEDVVDLNGTILPLAAQGTVQSEWLIDARNGMLFNSQGTDSYGNVSGITYSYDASGRLLGDSELIEPITQSACPIPLPGICPSYSSGVRTKAYDAENRLRSESYSIGEPLTLANPPGAFPSDTGEEGLWFNWTNQYNPLSITALDYGAAGHPMRFALLSQTAGQGVVLPGSSVPSSEAWLWDGNDRLLACTLNASAQCTAPVFSLNGVAEFSPSTGAVTVNDRNRYGSVADRHTSTAFGPWFDTDGLQRATMVGITKQPISMCSDNATPTDMVCFPVIDGKKSPDGWNRDMEQWQGVRSFDTNVGQWNTPDVYAGDVHDPMSQKPYMWNRNNPYAYSDPSGYQAEEEEEQLGTPSQLKTFSTGRAYVARLAQVIRQALHVPADAPEISEANAAHMFRSAKGHIPDTALNRAMLQRTSSNKANLVDSKQLAQGGTLETYRSMLPSGAQVWTEVRVTTDANGNTTREIVNGGVNLVPIKK